MYGAPITNANCVYLVEDGHSRERRVAAAQHLTRDDLAGRPVLLCARREDNKEKGSTKEHRRTGAVFGRNL